MRARIKVADCAVTPITVRDGKGANDRVTTFAASMIPLLENHLQRVKAMHEQDLAAGHGAVYVPHALERKYPNANREWGWQWVFPARDVSTDPRTGVVRRHHVDPGVVNKAIKAAVRRAGLTKVVSAHTFRHSFATHLLPRGTELIRSRPLAHPCGASRCARNSYSVSPTEIVGPCRTCWGIKTWPRP